MLVALSVLVVPALIIGLLDRQPEETAGQVACQGTVRLDGKLLAAGTITTRRDNATDGEPNAIATISSDGRFRLTTDGTQGAVVGHHRVAIQADLVPGVYRSLESTPLSIDVQPEARFNLFTLDLDSEK